jgi:uncharacterized RDD family membrane protein YckC
MTDLSLGPMTDTKRTEPLWFWRRIFAFIIDALLASLLTGLVVLAIWGGQSDKVRLAGSIGFTQSGCVPFQPSPSVRAVADAAWPGRNWTEVVRCEVVNYGLLTHRFVNFTETRRQGNTTMSIETNVAVDAQGGPVNPWFADWAALAVLVAGQFLFLTRSGQATPGMQLFDLVLESNDGHAPGPRQVITRMAICIGYWGAIAGLLTLIMWQVVWVAASVPLGILLFVIIAATGTLLWWRPDLFSKARRAPLHDRIAGLHMARKKGRVL